MRQPLEMGEQELNAFLTHLATLGQVSASTQNQALSASLFLCTKVLGGARSPRWCGEALVQLLYGSGLQLMAALRLRIEDVDCQSRQLTVRIGKGDKERATAASEWAWQWVVPQVRRW